MEGYIKFIRDLINMDNVTFTIIFINNINNNKHNKNNTTTIKIIKNLVKSRWQPTYTSIPLDNIIK